MELSQSWSRRANGLFLKMLLRCKIIFFVCHSRFTVLPFKPHSLKKPPSDPWMECHVRRRQKLGFFFQHGSICPLGTMEDQEGLCDVLMCLLSLSF